VSGTEFQPDRVEHDPKGWKFKSIAAGVRAFAQALAEGRPAPVSAEDGLYTIKVVEAAYASVKAGGTSVPV
jgi:predicted dehydrogenase